MINRRPWTAAEDAVLREHYSERGARFCAEQTGRPFRATVKRAERLGLRRRRSWSERDDAHLRVLWGPHTLPQIAKRLGRTEQAVYWRARTLKLGLGCPQGYEYLHEAAKRTGFCEAQLRRILRFAHQGAPVRAITRPGGAPKTKHVTHIVEPHDVDEAIAFWLSTETITEGARRHGHTASTLHRLAKLALERGDTRITPPPRKRRHRWRIPSLVIDELLETHRRLESLETAAVRHNVDPRTLREWLKATGIVARRGVRLEPSDVDAAVAARFATETIGDAARRHGRSWPFVRDIVHHAAAQGELGDGPQPGQPWRLAPETFDALIEKHLAGQSGRRVHPQRNDKETDHGQKDRSSADRAA